MLRPFLIIEFEKKWKGGGVISHVNMSKPLSLFSVFKPFLQTAKIKPGK